MRWRFGEIAGVNSRGRGTYAKGCLDGLDHHGWVANKTGAEDTGWDGAPGEASHLH